LFNVDRLAVTGFKFNVLMNNDEPAVSVR